MLYSCPNHELSREIIIHNFYARLSRNDQTMLDTSCVDSFMKKTIEFRWDLLERIKHNYEDQELNEGKESGIKLKFDCVKSFMNTNAFQKFSTKYELDSEIVASFCESFATHVDLPKEKWFMLEICPRGNNKVVIYISLYHDNFFIHARIVLTRNLVHV